MDTRAAASAYRESSFESAPPIKIVRLLYQGALRFLERAEQADPADAGSPFVTCVMRADSIVAELRAALNHEQAPELTDNLHQLYLFVEQQLRTALRERDKRHLTEARAVLQRLLQAWQHVEVSSR